MSSRDRETKSLQDKLKVFFKKGGSAPLPSRNELVVTSDLERDLGADTPIQRRLRVLKDIGDKVMHARVREGGVEKLWSCTRDLLEDSNVESRHAALWFLQRIAEGQADYLQIMRTILFRYLRNTHESHSPEDEQLRFKLLYILTNSGKNINCFEEEIGPFILEWLPSIESPPYIVEFLQLVINVVKYNATYLDEHIVHGIVDNGCALCCSSGEGGVVTTALSLLECVVSYSMLPRAALRTFVAALCRTVNIDAYCSHSWKLMRNVLGADIGHAALQELVGLLRGDAGEEDEGEAGLARGAVFYVNMALWGPRRVPALKVSFLSVLPAYRAGVERGQAVITYEVAVSVHSVVQRVPLELSEPAWDILLPILRAILHQDKNYNPPNELVHSKVHAVLTSIEQLHDAGQYCGNVNDLLDLIDFCGHDRPEASTMRLISGRLRSLPAGGAEWQAGALRVAERYVRQETRLNVRLHALHEIVALVRAHRSLGEELVKCVAVPVLEAAATDAGGAGGGAGLRAAAPPLLAELGRACTTDVCVDLIDLLEKILNRPFEMYVTDVPIPAEADVADLRRAVAGLLALLHAKLLAPPATHAARAFLVLLDHLDAHYRRPALLQHHPDIRYKIFEMLSGLRANQFNNVGFCYESSGEGAVLSGGAALRVRPLCSPYVLAEPPAQRGQQPPAPPKDPPPGTSMLPISRVSHIVLTILTRERDWAVLSRVLRALPLMLQTRALALGRRAQDLDLLASTLCSMISDRSLNFPECLRGSGSGAEKKPLASEFHLASLPALAAMAPYHAYLEPQTQQRIVRILLKYGMVLRTPQPYINALTIFTLETRDTMVKMLPEVLLDLSKISDTKAIASPMLEFLSTLTRLPRVFASFVEDQYMSVFAILLPYTNPSRYNHYVVSLAHHVIAAWFLKCRLSYRRNFVRFIIHGLHNYIIMPFKEQLYRGADPQGAAANEDSSSRQRSSSLGSKAVSRAPLGGRSGGPSASSASATFHVELTETCLDLLARYTSAPCSVKPVRSETAEFLFAGGQTMTWLVGHKVVTITTSGCMQNSLKQGMCERCLALCKQQAETALSPLPPLTPAPLPPALQHWMAQAAPDDDHAPLPQVVVNDEAAGELDDAHSTTSSNPSHAHAPHEVKRYSKHSLQHSRGTDTSSCECSSLSVCEPAPASASASASAHPSRQNSSERNPRQERVSKIMDRYATWFEKTSKEVDTDDGSWSRAGELAAAGSCPCWSSNWAEVHVRTATGDASWVLRVQNHMNWDYLLETPLLDVAAMLAPPSAGPPPAPPSSVSSGLGDSRQDVGSDSSPRSRSGSSSSQSRPPPTPMDLHKSSSDSVVGAEKKPPHAATHCIAQPQSSGTTAAARLGTQPINIPSSPQRHAPDEEDLLLVVPESKSRHPVRRSNSSPEMSSSWKAAVAAVAARDSTRSRPAPADEQADEEREDLPLDPEEMILLPSCEPTGGNTAGGAASWHGHKKGGKKADGRVSCEAIPEEISGTSPHAHAHAHAHQPAHAHLPAHVHAHADAQAHPHLCTFNSDPGTGADQPPASASHHNQLQKTASDGTVPEGRGGKPPLAARLRDDLPPLVRSKRSNTISVMSPTRRHSMYAGRPGAGGGPGVSGSVLAGGAGASGTAAGGGAGGGGGGGVSPSFVFLQLYHNLSTYPITPPIPGEPTTPLNPLAERPLRVTGAQHERTIKNLDLVPPVETYKIGVLYVGPGQQDNEVLILQNEYGSARYADFLMQLGSLVSLTGPETAEDANLFLNVERGGKDGPYTIVWNETIMQVLFHVATVMPTTAKDPNCNEKRKYIGNDYVSIVYNDSGADFNIHTIKGQLNLCIVVVEPYEEGLNRVLVKTKDERIRTKFLAHIDTQVVSDTNVALLARQVALHCSLASQISMSLKMGGAPYASNSLERLRLLKRLRSRVQAERLALAAREPAPYAVQPELAQRVARDDFNDYI